jgi:uncharacterized protein (TIGR03086 family)
MAQLLEPITDDMLELATPCSEDCLGDILDHCVGLTYAFTAAARKEDMGGLDASPPRGRVEHLVPDWRTRLPRQLDSLVEAWREPSATQGMAQAGEVTMPAEVMQLLAVDEVFVHGWDIAVSTGQSFEPDEDSRPTVHGFLTPALAENPEWTPGLFGPAVTVADDAPLLARTIALTGRDPAYPG